MTMFAFVSWIVIGAVIGAVLATVWKTRGLTLAWGTAVGGVGGVVGGMIARYVLPDGAVYDGLALAFAVLGAVLTTFLARARVEHKDQPGTVV
ncbi:MAG TPA: hypothetical protein VLT82_17390 [Myxococcaceae bacterium]|nr:hypothetical protein [Myxococcaceae bacterium]